MCKGITSVLCVCDHYDMFRTERVNLMYTKNTLILVYQSMCHKSMLIT